MAWSTPPTFVAGTPATAANLNIVSGDLAVIGGAWTSYTPTLTNITLNNGTVAAKYKQIDKTVTVRVRFAAGSGTIFNTGTLGISVPTGLTPHADYTTSAAGDWAVGAAVIQPTTKQGGTVIFNVAAGGVFNFLVDNLASSNLVTNLVPGTFGTSSVISFTATYEAA